MRRYMEVEAKKQNLKLTEHGHTLLESIAAPILAVT